MAGFLKSVPPAPIQQDGWVWDGANWCPPQPPGCLPPPCPPQPPGCPPWFPPPANVTPWYPGANGGVTFSATVPPNAIRGNFWYDGHVLWMFDGANWVDVGIAGIQSLLGGSGGAPVFIGATAPANPVPGALWWNGSILQLWDGVSWHLIGPQTITPATVSGRLVGINFYVVTQAITVPAAASSAVVQMWGASGGTGGISNGVSGGSGAGGYLEKFLSPLTPGLNFNFTCGQGGSPGASGGAGNNGGSGSVTVLSSGSQSIPTLTCNPSGGTLGSTGPLYSAGSVGGTASGGDINITGQTGGDAGGDEVGFPPGGQTFYATGADGTTYGTGAGPGNPGKPGGLKITWLS